MQNGEPYDAHTPEMRAWRGEVKKLLRRLNITEYHEPTMASITRELLPNSAPDVFVEPPFHCDYHPVIKDWMPFVFLSPCSTRFLGMNQPDLHTPFEQGGYQGEKRFFIDIQVLDV